MSYLMTRGDARGACLLHWHVYDFVLPASKMNLIKKALAAFDKDIPKAYAVKSGKVIIMRPSDPEPEQQTWFEMIMACVNGIDASNSEKTNRALATKAYTLIRDVKSYPEVTEQDKASLRQILKALRSDKRIYDTLLTELLQQCEAAIK